MKYFSVTCIRGHQGTNVGDLTITFYFSAKSSFEAMKKGQKMPGVKHDKLPLRVQEITKERYLQERRISAYAR